MPLSMRDHGGVRFRFIAGCSGSDWKGDSPDPDPEKELSGPPGSSRWDRPGVSTSQLEWELRNPTVGCFQVVF